MRCSYNQYYCALGFMFLCIHSLHCASGGTFACRIKPCICRSVDIMVHSVLAPLFRTNKLMYFWCDFIDLPLCGTYLQHPSYSCFAFCLLSLINSNLIQSYKHCRSCENKLFQHFLPNVIAFGVLPWARASFHSNHENKMKQLALKCKLFTFIFTFWVKLIGIMIFKLYFYISN